MTSERRAFGLWDSPITPASLARGTRLSSLSWDSDGRTLAWLEGRSSAGVPVVLREGEIAPREMGDGLSVRALVGYGGGDLALARGDLWFVSQKDQRIYRQALDGGPPRAITPPFGAASSPALSPNGRWLVYVHTFEDQDCIAVVDAEGKSWPAMLTSGRDFYMQPAWAPSGSRLTWVEWDHPNMPWDGTEVKVADLAFPEGGPPRTVSARSVAGGRDVSVQQPTFTGDGASILYISDESGWGHVYKQDHVSGRQDRVTAGEGDFGQPAWAQGRRRFAATRSGAVIGVRNRAGFESLVLVDEEGHSRDLADLADTYTSFDDVVASPTGDRLAIIASGPSQPPRVAVIDLAGAEPATTVYRRGADESIPGEAFSRPVARSWESFDGGEAHGLYYPPAGSRFESTGKPPLVVKVHGGPTSQAGAGWDASVQFFTTRGYGVLLPNHRGSTGYGRDYMLKLRDSWGIYDVQDSKWGAQSLAEAGLIDGSRMVIMGGSAGGYTVLQSLVDVPGFYRAGICSYGISNQFTLVSGTHKFEARYSDSLLEPLPAAAKVYRDRSPIFHAEKIVDPVLVFQGDEDGVVPREQSDSIVASLRARGVPHEYHVYPGEGHGWRKSETIEHFYSTIDAFLRQWIVYA